MGVAGSQSAGTAAAERFDAAHRALLGDPSIQFSLPPAPPPPKPPVWLEHFLRWLGHVLKPVGRLFDWIGSLLPQAPYARILLWGVLGIAAAGLVYILVDRFRHGVWRLPRLRKPAAAETGEADWAPDAAPARAWLREADALAADGRFAEAAHHLLRRCVEDIARRRPRLVRPALTSRDLAAASAIPPAARTIFSDIAAIVERSLFGGRPVGAPEWERCRTAYTDFALSRAWA